MRFFIAFLLSFAVLMGLAHFTWGKILPPPPELDWVLALEDNKWGAAEAASSPRILIIGGSEAHYGLSAEIFERETGLPAFNLGTHAGLSWRTHYLNTKRLLRSGDIVVFSVNYVRLMADDPRDLEVRYWRERDPASVFEFPVRYWPVFMGGDLLGEGLKSLGYPPGKGWLRRADAISPRGDETANMLEGKRSAQDLSRLRRTGITPPFKGEAPGLAEILKLKQAVEARGGRFYVVFPGQLDRPRFHDRPAYEGNFQAVETLFRDRDIEILNDMESALLPIELMYDTVYHPTGAGRARISTPAAKTLARDLKAEGVMTRDTMESSS
ncbi:MAG: hypothetical protein H2040_00410 [Euryhalocaulis sp.]|uniref:hypothetical protein n=1 Tax=Euryhalocaulis sp. TaxID=2744307 RepID=UPI0017D3D530|nr:hypothetical protein [Euryhalocaulis sp.]MBA4800302.1 hypothetical protein [Euryhalocaulis sp.]